MSQKFEVDRTKNKGHFQLRDTLAVYLETIPCYRIPSELTKIQNLIKQRFVSFDLKKKLKKEMKNASECKISIVRQICEKPRFPKPIHKFKAIGERQRNKCNQAMIIVKYK